MLDEGGHFNDGGGGLFAAIADDAPGPGPGLIFIEGRDDAEAGRDARGQGDVSDARRRFARDVLDMRSLAADPDPRRRPACRP